MSPKDDIDVLLATFNGELYLKEFLDSLYAQEQVNIHLIVSDDGSTDSTLNILDSYKSKFIRFTLLSGPQDGPMRNFFFLLRASNASFLAFADQDDIWEKEHLKNSINRIRDIKVPAMTYSSVKEFSEISKSDATWPLKYSGPDFPSILFENTARGCAIVLNKQAKEIINMREPKKAIMHDWWVLVLIKLFGTVIYEPRPEVNYRIHKSNFIGNTKRRKLYFIKTLITGIWSPIHQIDELIDFQHKNCSLNASFDLENFSRDLNGGTFQRFSKIILNFKVRYRLKALDEIKFRIGLLFLNVLNRNGSH